MTAEAAARISDLQFTETYRVPFQYSRLVREHLGAGAFMQSSAGVTVTDLDGNVFYDLTGSYGVNIFGYDFYKECIDGSARSARMSSAPCSAPTIRSIADNVAAAVRDLRPRRSLVPHVRHRSRHAGGAAGALPHPAHRIWCVSAGAYHGWWGDVQPGVGNPVSPHETYTLADMSERTLHVLRTRRDIACVLVNPLQALHPNATRRAIPRCVDSSRTARVSIARPTPNGSSSCARSAPSAASC